MDKNPDAIDSVFFQILYDYAPWIAAAGALSAMLMFWLIVKGVLQGDERWLPLARGICWAMLITPIATRLYFSQYVILWSAGLLALVGSWIVLKNKLGL